MEQLDNWLPGRGSDARPALAALSDGGADGRFAAEVGVRIHRVIAMVAADRTWTSNAALIDRIVGATNAVMREYPMPMRHRAASRKAMTYACVYFREFVPPEGWELVAVEAALGSSRLDLVWAGPEGVLADEVKASGYGDPLMGAATRAQLDRHLANCEERYGERLIGVRLLALAAPRHSRLVVDRSTRLLLAETPYWFGGAGE
jgi:hypothetical protein